MTQDRTLSGEAPERTWKECEVSCWGWTFSKCQWGRMGSGSCSLSVFLLILHAERGCSALTATVDSRASPFSSVSFCAVCPSSALLLGFFSLLLTWPSVVLHYSSPGNSPCSDVCALRRLPARRGVFGLALVCRHHPCHVSQWLAQCQELCSSMILDFSRRRFGMRYT